MQVADQPAVVHIAHDVFDAVEGRANVWRKMHSERDAGHDHDHECDARERAEVPPLAQIPWGWVLIELVMHKGENWQPVIDPSYNSVLEDWSTPNVGHCANSSLASDAQSILLGPHLHSARRWTRSFKVVLRDALPR